MKIKRFNEFLGVTINHLVKESNSESDPYISLLEDLFADQAESMNVEVENMGEDFITDPILRRIIDPINLDNLKNINQKFYFKCHEILAGNLYHILTSEYVNKNDLSDIRNRCEKHGIMYISCSPFYRGHSMIFMKNSEIIIGKILSLKSKEA